jgi:hypothetical protein
MGETIFWLESLKPKYHSEELGVVNIRMYHSERGWEVLDWMYLSQDTDQWLVNRLMKFGFHKIWGIS